MRNSNYPDLLSHMLPQSSIRSMRFCPTVRMFRRWCAFRRHRGPLPLTASVSLKAYNDSLQSHLSANERVNKQRAFGEEIIRHVNHVADMLIAPRPPGTAHSCLCLRRRPFSDIHAHHREAVDLAVSRRIWLVSPTTLLAVLNTPTLGRQCWKSCVKRKILAIGWLKSASMLRLAHQGTTDGTRLLDKAGQTEPPAANPKINLCHEAKKRRQN